MVVVTVSASKGPDPANAGREADCGRPRRLDSAVSRIADELDSAARMDFVERTFDEPGGKSAPVPAKSLERSFRARCVAGAGREDLTLAGPST